MFPFGRGLTHAYWAPNLWALYNLMDIILCKLFQSSSSQLTRGLISDEYSTNILPVITPLFTLLLTLVFMVPVLYKVWKKPHPYCFLSAALYIMMTSFMCGYHVHEKAILMVSIPLCLISLDSTSHATLAFIFNIIANFTLLPLLPEMQETWIKLVLYVIYHLLLYIMFDVELRFCQSMNFLSVNGLKLSVMHWLYICGVICVQIFFSVLQPLFFVKWEFLPLMFYSVYGSIGFIYCWYRCFRLFQDTQNIVF